MKTAKKQVLIFLFVIFLLPFPLHALTSRDIEGDIMCICKDNCGKVLVNCTCGTSEEYRKEIMAMINAGKTKQEIIQHYIDRFGEKVLASPSKSGFNLTAWIFPFVALFAGAWGIHKVVRSWVDKRKTGSPLKASLEKAADASTAPQDPYKKKMEEDLKEYDS